MTDFIWGNNASSVLAAPVAALDTTIELAAGTGERFPDPYLYAEHFSLTLKNAETGENEIVYVVERMIDTLVVQRAQEGTVAGTFPAGSPAVHTLTAGALDYLRDL